MSTSNPGPPPAEDSKRAFLLEAALGVFARYGYRKTSMDEVARAAQISRQGLYLHFPNKEELFRATVRHTMESSLSSANHCLARLDLPLPDRLVSAFDAWVGHYIGRFAADAADLIEAAEGLLMTEVLQHQARFADTLTECLREAGIAGAYKATGVTPRDVANTLLATSKGLKHLCQTREAFLESFTVAVRIVCTPLAS
ncbi:MAG TPA: TetR/AcrR family transcriptional regulator [Opitutaceae bacterium]|nr:TetR/AcrR family transcriptional regulator [Opitutaceae bacterium]